MKKLCKNCNLNYQIEEGRKKLNHLIEVKGMNLLDDKIIQLSQGLDEFIYRCVFCEKNLNVESGKALDLKDIFGTHSTFYYYGKEHLFTNMYFYITEGIKNNELVYMSMQETLYEELLKLLELNHVPIEHIGFRPVKELILSNKEGGLFGLKDKINRIFSEDKVKKYKGVRWIGQPTYAIQTTSQEDFLDWEVNLSESLKNTAASLICIYDAYDCMTESKFINKEVIDKSIDTHSHMLKDFVLEGIN